MSVTFNIDVLSIRINCFWFPRFSGVNITTSFSGSNRNFLKLLFHMFPYKAFKSII